MSKCVIILFYIFFRFSKVLNRVLLVPAILRLTLFMVSLVISLTTKFLKLIVLAFNVQVSIPSLKCSIGSIATSGKDLVLGYITKWQNLIKSFSNRFSSSVKPLSGTRSSFTQINYCTHRNHHFPEGFSKGNCKRHTTGMNSFHRYSYLWSHNVF